MQRLFVAIELPETVKDLLTLVCAGLPGAKWRTREQMHLTLRFIGEVRGDVARDVEETLAEVRAPAFDLRLRGIGHFGDRRRARLLWAGVEPCDELFFLNERIERSLVRIGLEPERRKFRPHVTIAKLNGTRMDRVNRFEAEHCDFVGEPFHVDQFTLFSSFLSGEGAIYTPEADFGLAENPAAVESAVYGQ